MYSVRAPGTCRMAARLAPLLGLMGLILGATATAGAQSRPRGLAIDHFEGERGSDWFTTASLDFRGHLRPTVGATFNWAYLPTHARRAGEGPENAASDRV